jgi:hypothetical protein
VRNASSKIVVAITDIVRIFPSAVAAGATPDITCFWRLIFATVEYRQDGQPDGWQIVM